MRVARGRGTYPGGTTVVVWAVGASITIAINVQRKRVVEVRGSDKTARVVREGGSSVSGLVWVAVF
jgi:hypothetical protein